MRTAVAALVQPIFDAGISLRDRLEASEPLEWDRERALLKSLLARLQVEATEDENGFDFSMPDHPAEQSRLTRNTMRYALTCWLDDFLGYHSAWGLRWRQETLESELFLARASERKFWDEARYARTRGDVESLEVMYWCALLGYRGEWRSDPNRVAAWAARVRGIIEQQAQTWTMPASLAPSPHEMQPPADLLYRSMVFSVLLTVALTAPLALLLAWRFSL